MKSYYKNMDTRFRGYDSHFRMSFPQTSKPIIQDPKMNYEKYYSNTPLLHYSTTPIFQSDVLSEKIINSQLIQYLYD